MKRTLLFCFFFFGLFVESQAQLGNRKPINRAEFVRLMQTVAAGLNENNGRKAADCFTLDAIYSEPPNKQIYRGRDRIFEFFGGWKGRPKVVQMVWHHLTFDEQTQVGSGEFTLTNGSSAHGMGERQNPRRPDWQLARIFLPICPGLERLLFCKTRFEFWF